MNLIDLKKDVFRNVIGGWMVGSFTGALGGLFIIEVPAENKDLIVFMLGQLSGFVGAVVAFNFGTTKSSAEKNATIKQMTEEERATGKADDPVHIEE